MDGYLIFDNHFHLNYENNFLEGARRFKKAGGNAINLTNLPDYSLPSENYYKTIYERTISMANAVRRETGLTVLVTLGPYPLDYNHFSEMNLDSENIVKNGIDLAAKLIEEGVTNAMGEIGRPHFPVSDLIIDKSNNLLEYAFSRCGELECPAILHTEDLDNARIEELEDFARRNGFNPMKIIKHHALPSNLLKDSKMNFSIPATRKFVRESISTKKKFLLETDYINDPKDDNRFLPPDSVPLRANMIRQNYPDSWEQTFKNTFRDLPLEIFGSEPFKCLLQ
ncbi:MAG: TatD family hydrolase [Cuniculiplasma sp.]|jgi:TatD-related deoxyribonuclease|nr:TatD family hydrolase [Cuniculiplasma sp.]